MRRMITEEDLLNKQDKLVAGDNITIEGNVISAVGGGTGDVTKEYVDKELTKKQDKLSQVDLDNIAMINQYAQNIMTNTNDISALQTTKQDKLEAGDNISIVGNTISATVKEGPQGPIGETGPIGPTGETGPQGPQGENGSRWYVGEGEPRYEKEDGDFYLDSTSGNIYLRASNQWFYKGCIQGPKGEQGLPGNKWYFGVGKPTLENKVNGDLYLEQINGTVYSYKNGAWERVVGLKGPQGPEGLDGKPGKDGQDGAPGKDGVSITSIGKTQSQGLIDIYTINYSDGNHSTFTVTNGKDADPAQLAQIETNKNNISELQTNAITTTEEWTFILDDGSEVIKNVGVK